MNIIFCGVSLRNSFSSFNGFYVPAHSGLEGLPLLLKGRRPLRLSYDFGINVIFSLVKARGFASKFPKFVLWEQGTIKLLELYVFENDSVLVSISEQHFDIRRRCY